MKMNTKSKLISSLLVLVLCVTAFAGSTYAWFTDSVTSAGNRIVAGNLAVDLLKYDEATTNYVSIKNGTGDIFQAGGNGVNWEPGKTEYVYLAVENEGSLALKYNFLLNVTDGGLASALEYAIVKGVDYKTEYDNWSQIKSAAAFNGNVEAGEVKAAEYAGTNVAPGAMDYFVLAVHMKEDAGNGYMEKDITIDVKVEATQKDAESDSFGDDYDVNAPTVNIDSEDDFEDVKEGDIINLCNDVTLSEAVTLPANVELRGNGKQINGTIYAGGDLTILDHVKVTAFSASYYDRTITIGEGACLEITGTGRMSFAYGNVFNITGTLDNAKTANKTAVQPSLIIPGGMSITGGNDAEMNITNAYVKIGSTTSKDNAANGKFTLKIVNSIADFTNQLTLAEPTSGMNPTFNINIKDSVLTTGTKFIVAAPNSEVVIDNSTVTLGSYFRNSGNMTIKNGSAFTGKTIQFGENGGNDGTTTVDNSTFTIIGGSTGLALDGKGTGELVLNNGATATVDYYKDMTVTTDATSTFTGTEVN